MKAPGVLEKKLPITPKTWPFGRRYQAEPVQQSFLGATMTLQATRPVVETM